MVIKIRLPDGRLYDQTGKLNFVNNTIAQNTDTITLRGTIPNPPLHDPADDRRRGARTDRRRIRHGRCWRACEPVEVLAIPRSAVLSDQQGDYVFIVGADNKAEQRRIQLGQSTPTIAAVISGLALGDKVIVEGLQRVRPGQPVAPGPASALIQSSMKTAAADGRTETDGGSRDRDQARGRQPMISSVFVDRPRLAIVIAFVITIAGALALLQIPVAQFPDIVPPQVTVTAELSRRLRRRGGIQRRPAARGAGRRRRQDALHEVDQRQ